MLNINISGKDIILIVIILGLGLWLFISQIRNNKLQNQLNEERISNLGRIDSLTYINKQHLKTIHLYEIEIEKLQNQRDSLNKVKSEYVKKKEDVVIAKDASTAANTLKDNLKKWKN